MVDLAELFRSQRRWQLEGRIFYSEADDMQGCSKAKGKEMLPRWLESGRATVCDEISCLYVGYQ